MGPLSQFCINKLLEKKKGLGQVKEPNNVRPA